MIGTNYRKCIGARALTATVTRLTFCVCFFLNIVFGIFFLQPICQSKVHQSANVSYHESELEFKIDVIAFKNKVFTFFRYSFFSILLLRPSSPYWFDLEMAALFGFISVGSYANVRFWYVTFIVLRAFLNLFLYIIWFFIWVWQPKAGLNISITVYNWDIVSV